MGVGSLGGGVIQFLPNGPITASGADPARPTHLRAVLLVGLVVLYGHDVRGAFLRVEFHKVVLAPLVFLAI